jgi:hypothetical protein
MLQNLRAIYVGSWKLTYTECTPSCLAHIMAKDCYSRIYGINLSQISVGPNMPIWDEFYDRCIGKLKCARGKILKTAHVTSLAVRSWHYKI